MGVLVSSQQVEAVLREHLNSEGYQLSEPRENGETGADVIAIRGTEFIAIECISYKSSPPMRSKDFYESFFRAVSRLKTGATIIVIALPSDFSYGLRDRAAVYGLAWERIGEAFAELQIWLVDVDRGTFTKTSWASWLQKK